MFYADEEMDVNSNTRLGIGIFQENFSDKIIVEINADSEDHCIVLLSNQTGRTLRMKSVNLNQGKNQVHLDQVDVLRSGIYQLSVKNKQSDFLYSSILTKF